MIYKKKKIQKYKNTKIQKYKNKRKKWFYSYTWDSVPP